MSFIELTRSSGEKVTVNADHILTLSKEGETGADIALAGGSVHAPARVLVTESYDEVRRRLGLGWLRCGETYHGEICDRRLDMDSRCPIHGRVGE